MGHVFGKWEEIPELDYVTVVRVGMTSKKFQASSNLYVQSPASTFQYQINIATKDNKQRIIKILICDKENAINEAIKIGEDLKLNVLDYTKPESRWIKVVS